MPTTFSAIDHILSESFYPKISIPTQAFVELKKKKHKNKTVNKIATGLLVFNIIPTLNYIFFKKSMPKIKYTVERSDFNQKGQKAALEKRLKAGKCFSRYSFKQFLLTKNISFDGGSEWRHLVDFHKLLYIITSAEPTPRNFFLRHCNTIISSVPNKKKIKTND